MVNQSDNNRWRRILNNMYLNWNKLAGLGYRFSKTIFSQTDFGLFHHYINTFDDDMGLHLFWCKLEYIEVDKLSYIYYFNSSKSTYTEISK